VSALLTLTVVLKPAHGGAPPPEGVTARTLAQHAPDPEAAEHVRRWFAEQGFEVTPVTGTAFAVTAPREHVAATLAEPPDVGELPLGRLPDDVARHVAAVVAEPPPDFGPTSW